MARNILMAALSTFLTMSVVTSPLIYAYLSTVAPEWAVRRFDPATGNGDPLGLSIFMSAFLLTAASCYSWAVTFVFWEDANDGK